MVWLFDDEDRPQVARHFFRSKTRMVTIFISRNGPLLIKMLSDGGHVNATYYREEILQPLLSDKEELLRPSEKLAGRRPMLVLHHDNASSHTAAKVKDFLESSEVRTAPHTPYSPDLAPLDFWVFPRLKEDLAGTSFERPQDLGRAINQRLKSYGEEWYAACYVKWCEGLQKCIEQQGGYVEGLRQWFLFFLLKYSFHSTNCIIFGTALVQIACKLLL